MGGSQSTSPPPADPGGESDSRPGTPRGRSESNAVLPITAPGELGFDSKVTLTDLSSKIQLSLRCEDLPQVCRSMVVVYSKNMQDEIWSEVGMTEINDADDACPVYDRALNVEFRVEEQRLLRLEVYKIKDAMDYEDLSCQRFIGSAEAMLVDAMMARGQPKGNGWLSKHLQTHKANAAPPGKICLFAEEDTTSKYSISFRLAGKGIKCTDFWKGLADPYCIIYRTMNIPRQDDEPDDLKCTPVYRTEVARKARNPKFKRVELNSAQLCQNSGSQDVVIEVYDWFRVQKHRYIGECVTTFDELHKAWRNSRPIELPISVNEGRRVPKAAGRSRSASRSKSTVALRAASKISLLSSASRHSLGSSSMTSKSGRDRRTSTKDSRDTEGSKPSKGSQTLSELSDGGTQAASKIVGHLRLEDVGVERRFSFLDYVRSGLELRLAVAIDFTRSNAGPQNADSYHCMRPDRQSAYATAIRAVGDILKSYDSDNSYPVYGFGAKIPPSHTFCSDCFALTGDFFEPEVEGVDGIIAAYRRALQIVRLHGPTHLAEVIRLAAELARPYAEHGAGSSMKYFVLLILTDGGVDDQLETLNEVLRAAELPLSIVAMGIGDGDFGFLRDLAREVGEHRRASEAKKANPSDLRGPPRDLVHFVAYDDYRDRPHELAAATLAEIPREVAGYFTGKNVKPKNLDKLEDENGNPIGKTTPAPADKRKRTTSKQHGSATGTASHASSRSSTKTESAVSITTSLASLSTVARKAEKEQRKKLAEMPPFLREERDRLMEKAESLGYDKSFIKKAMTEGIAAGKIEVLVDNLMHAGYGKLPTYKAAALHALPDWEVNLPGQPTSHSVSAATLQQLQQSAPNFRKPSHESRVQWSSERSTIMDFMANSNRSSRFGTKELRGDGSKEPSLPRSRTGTLELPPVGLSRESSRVLDADAAGSNQGTKEKPRRSKSILIAGARSREGTKERAVSWSFTLEDGAGMREAGAALREAGTARADEGSTSKETCVVCLQAPIATEFVPCGHKLACESCAAKLGGICILCQGSIHEVRKLAT